VVFKLILLPLRGDPAEAPAVATALSVARLFDAHVTALHVRPDVEQDMAALAAADMGMAAGLEPALSRMEKEAEAHEQAAVATWKALCTEGGFTEANHPGPPGPTAAFQAETGDEAEWVASLGRTADLIVAGRGDDAPGDIGILETALLQSGKPLLIAPDRTPAAGLSLAGTVGIAWKDGREAAIAVAAALPFLHHARRVLIFCVPEDGEAPDATPARLAHALRWHAPDVAVKLLPRGTRSPAAVLLEAAAELGCGLLVMGGYGHGRLREAVFGGFTRAVLQAAPMPVLMAH